MNAANRFLVLCLTLCVVSNAYCRPTPYSALLNARIAALLSLPLDEFADQHAEFMRRYQAAENNGRPLSDEFIDQYRIFTDAARQRENYYYEFERSSAQLAHIRAAQERRENEYDAFHTRTYLSVRPILNGAPHDYPLSDDYASSSDDEHLLFEQEISDQEAPFDESTSE